MGVIHRRAESSSHGGAGWDGVKPQAYDDPSLAGVRKHELIGEAEGARDYRMRYFEVPAGGRTARERHAHDHGVMIVAGRARVTLGDRTYEVGEGDVVYVSGDELHCFETVGAEALGFVCVVGPRRPTAA
jgi:S-methyl-1-thioxylulose 5-phosphate methylthiotransferase